MHLLLTWSDYVIFLFVLILCLGVGVYYGFQKNTEHQRQRSNDRTHTEVQNYFLGGRAMAVFPVSISLVSSIISAISFIGTSTEVYLYGTQYMFLYFPLVLVNIVMSTIFLPIFHPLKLTSVYEYLELRYDKRVRLLASFLYVLKAFISMPLLVYVPALALNQVTGFDLMTISAIACIICMFYTSLGGIKAVVWTDVIQAISIVISLVLVTYLATQKVGGLKRVWEINYNSDRIEFPEITTDLNVRHSIISTALGGFCVGLGTLGVNQTTMQRYLTLPTLRKTRQATWIFSILYIALTLFTCYNGMLLYANYFDCDPLTTKIIKKKDQLYSLFIVDILNGHPGFAGLFFAGIFSASLSSISTLLNAIAAVSIEDFWKSYTKTELTVRQVKFISRGVVIVAGTATLALVFPIQHMGTILQLAMSVTGTASGPVIGLFVMGALMPIIDSKSALFGGCIGIVLTMCLCVKAQLDIVKRILKFPIKPLSTEGCVTDILNSTLPHVTTTALNVTGKTSENNGSFFHISYLLYGAFGMCITILASSIIRLVFVKQSKNVDAKLLAPFLRQCVTHRNFNQGPINGIECTTYSFSDEKIENDDQ